MNPATKLIDEYIAKLKLRFPFSCSFDVGTSRVWEAQDLITDWAINYCTKHYPKYEKQIFETYVMPLPSGNSDGRVVYKILFFSRFRDLTIQAKLSVNV